MVVAPRGLAVKLPTPRSVRLVRWPGQLAPRLTAQLTSNRHRPVTGSPSAVPTDRLSARRRARRSSSMPWSAAPTPRVCTPWCPRRHVTGHRLVAVPWGDGLRDKFW